MCSAITLNSRRHDFTSIERYVNQSRLCLFVTWLHDNVTISWPSSVYEASWSEMVHLTEVSSKCIRIYKLCITFKFSDFVVRSLLSVGGPFMFKYYFTLITQTAHETYEHSLGADAGILWSCVVEKSTWRKSFTLTGNHHLPHAYLFIYIHYFERVNTFSYAAILPCGPLSTNIQAFIQAYTWNT